MADSIERKPELPGWRPCREAHAIERASIGINFSQRMTEIPLGKALRSAREATKELGSFVESQVQEFTVAIHPATGSTTHQASAQGLERWPWLAEKLPPRKKQ